MAVKPRFIMKMKKYTRTYYVNLCFQHGTPTTHEHALHMLICVSSRVGLLHMSMLYIQLISKTVESNGMEGNVLKNVRHAVMANIPTMIYTGCCRLFLTVTYSMNFNSHSIAFTFFSTKL